MFNFMIVAITLHLCIYSVIGLPFTPHVTNREINDFNYCTDKNLTLRFSKSDIRTIGENFVASPLITCLDLSYNNINEIDPNAFNLVPNLKYLNLQGNKFRPSEILTSEHLNVEVLILSGMTPDRCCPPYVERIGGIHPMLRILDLSSNGLLNIEFKDPDRIIYGFQFTASLGPFPQLEHLNLSNNNIDNVEFQKLLPPNLTHLYLDNNLIVNGYIYSLENLLVLTLDDNNIHFLTSGMSLVDGFNLSKLKTLKYLSVARNQLSRIQGDTFDHMTDLEHLDLSSNKVEFIYESMFRNMKKLRNLILNDNLLNELSIQMLPQHLTYLAINCNNLEYFSRELFVNLSNLTTLLLAGNKISNDQIMADTFDDLHQLEELNLKQNNLSSLPANWYSSLKKLKYLDLSNNKFDSIEALSLGNDTFLETIDLRNNNLKYLNVRSFKNLSENLTIIISDEDISMIKCKERKSMNQRYYY